MNIKLHIERLVLDGLPVTRSQGPLVQAAMEAELARLMAEGGLAGAGIGRERCRLCGRIAIKSLGEVLLRSAGRLPKRCMGELENKLQIVCSGQKPDSQVSALLEASCSGNVINVARGEDLQRSAVSAPDTVPPIVHEVLRSPGRPLDAANARIHGAAIWPRLQPDTVALHLAG